MYSCSSVYGRVRAGLAGRWLIVIASLCAAPLAQAQAGDDIIIDAQAAYAKKDKPRLAADRAAALAAQHPLAMWADYWDLNNRLADATPADVE
ncbi:MAG TPA: hypothetical protein VJ598_02380, partial [Albitalea sp.]|nr:hypothetical protein [Albitalea sp.]